jgi:hypothetical protein
MVRVGRVSQPEEERHRECQQQDVAAQPGNGLVEPEHQPLAAATAAWP